MMTASSLLLLYVVFMTQFSLDGCVVEVEYSHKVVSERIGDGFAYSLATSYRKLVVGAPWTNDNCGSMMVDAGIRIYGPRGNYFGYHVGVNQNFVVTSITNPYTVYVYESNSPYNLKATFPTGGEVWDIAISDDNTIAVSISEYKKNRVTIFVYDGQGSWHIGEELKTENHDCSIAFSGTTLVIGDSVASWPKGSVHVHNKSGEKWSLQQTIRNPDVNYFGHRVTKDGNHMAATSYPSGFVEDPPIIFTYELNTISNSWINNGRFTFPGPKQFPFISMKKNILVVSFTSHRLHPNVCGYVYRRSETTNNDKNESGALYQWNHIANLTTNDDPMTDYDETHGMVKIEDNLVFTGRWYSGRYIEPRGIGKVFLHDISNLQSNNE